MKIEKSFAVKAPPGQVWAFLTDPHRVVRCVPGAEITEQIDEETHGGTITLKVGAIALRYKGKVRFERLDAATRQAELVASGRETRGKGGADARVTSRLREGGPGETQVETVADLTVSGLLAQMGRGMIQDVSDQLFETFTEAVRTQLEGAAPTTGEAAAGEAPAGEAQSGAPPQAEPVQVVSLGANVLGRAAARTARRPGVWIAAVVVLLLLWLWLRG